MRSLRHKAAASILAIMVPAASMGGTLNLTVEAELAVSGGTVGTTVMDQDQLTRTLPTGGGSASLAALRSVNLDTDPGGAFYFNRSTWELQNVFLTPDNPGVDVATFILGGQLTAILSGYNPEFSGTGSRVGVSYSIRYYDNRPNVNRFVSFGETIFAAEVALGHQEPNQDYLVRIDQFVGKQLTLPTNTPIEIGMTLATTAGYGNPNLNPGPGFARADAGNTFAFNPDAFFDFLTPGVTANAGTFLVNNQLPAFQTPSAPVPAPTPGALMLVGTLGLVWLRRHRVR